jgi:hypothetical protein
LVSVVDLSFNAVAMRIGVFYLYDFLEKGFCYTHGELLVNFRIGFFSMGVCDGWVVGPMVYK